MPISDLVTLRHAYVTQSNALATCRKAQMAPQPHVSSAGHLGWSRRYEKAYEAYQQALLAYNVEAELVAPANYPRPDMNPLPRFDQ